MLSIFKWELKSNFKSLIFWSLGIFVMAAVGFAEYGMVLESGTSMAPMVDMMPRIIKIMMGFGELSIDTVEGWYACMYLWLVIIAFVHAALLGATIISKEERDKTSEFIFTKPIKRSTVITAKVLASLINVFVVAFIAWITTLAVLWTHIKGTDLPEQITLTMVGMLITQIIFLAAGFFLSALFTEKGKAGSYAAVLVIVTYFGYVLVEMFGDIDFLNIISPFSYFNVVDVLENGLKGVYIFISALLIGGMGYFTYLLFGKRNLHS